MHWNLFLLLLVAWVALATSVPYKDYAVWQDYVNKAEAIIRIPSEERVIRNLLITQTYKEVGLLFAQLLNKP